MKTLKLLLIASAASIAFTSCLNNNGESDVPDVIVKGVEMYNTAAGQSLYTLDAAAIAFRLNVLLTDAKAQDVTSLDDVLTEAGNSERNYLFGSTGIEKDYNGVVGDYKLTFEMAGTKGQYDRTRDGAVIISTGGKLLTELANDGGMWIIDFSDPQKLRYPDTSAASQAITVENADEYTIYPSDDANGYTVAVKNYRSYVISSYTSSWTGVYNIIPQTSETLSMKTARNTVYHLNYVVSGKSMYDLAGRQPEMRLGTISDIVYKPACGMSSGSIYKHSGEEQVAFVGSADYDTTEYPSSFAIVTFTPQNSTGDCAALVSATITYSGQSYTF